MFSIAKNIKHTRGERFYVEPELNEENFAPRVTYEQVVAAKNRFEPLNGNLFELLAEAFLHNDTALQAVFTAGTLVATFHGFQFFLPKTKEVLELNPSEYGLMTMTANISEDYEVHTLPFGEPTEHQWGDIWKSEYEELLDSVIASA